MVRDIKANSTKFINERNWIKGKFNWQEGFGAFSYSKSHIGNVINYILNQEEHHKAKTFKTEYLDFLESILKYKNTNSLPDIEQALNFSATKTTGMIMYKGFYFKLKLKDMFKFAELEAEKLFIQGIIK